MCVAFEKLIRDAFFLDLRIDELLFCTYQSSNAPCLRGADCHKQHRQKWERSAA